MSEPTGLILIIFAAIAVLYLLLKVPVEPPRQQCSTLPDTPPTGDDVEIIVVGTEYYKGAASMTEGKLCSLTLRREPRNRHDPNAIAVFNGVRKVGYLSQFQAKRYKDLVDSSGGFYSVVGKKSKTNVYVLLPRI